MWYWIFEGMEDTGVNSLFCYLILEMNSLRAFNVCPSHFVIKLRFVFEKNSLISPMSVGISTIHFSIRHVHSITRNSSTLISITLIRTATTRIQYDNACSTHRLRSFSDNNKNIRWLLKYSEYTKELIQNTLIWQKRGLTQILPNSSNKNNTDELWSSVILYRIPRLPTQIASTDK